MPRTGPRGGAALGASAGVITLSSWGGGAALRRRLEGGGAPLGRWGEQDDGLADLTPMVAAVREGVILGRLHQRVIALDCEVREPVSYSSPPMDRRLTNGKDSATEVS